MPVVCSCVPSSAALHTFHSTKVVYIPYKLLVFALKEGPDDDESNCKDLLDLVTSCNTECWRECGSLRSQSNLFVLRLSVVSAATCLAQINLKMTVISLMKYLMFVFNGLVFIGGICLLSVGIWVITDPDGVQNIISNPYLNAVAFLVVFVGVALSFLGFLGCYGAISQNREMLLFFFLLVLLSFILEIVAAVLIHIHGQKIRDDFFLMQLKQNYQGDNSSDVFSRTWNTFMIMVQFVKKLLHLWLVP